MGQDDSEIRSELLPGTLDLLVLHTLARGPMHGYGIAQHLERTSTDVLRIGEGSLYPALQRMQLKGWVRSAWAESATGRKVRTYRLTAAGRARLGLERESYHRMIGAINAVLRTT
jgi:PadR family transcriptional regulator PadR